MTDVSEFLEGLLHLHASYAWDKDALGFLAGLKRSYFNVEDIDTVAEGLCIPVDCPATSIGTSATGHSEADCFGVKLTLLHQLPHHVVSHLNKVPGHDWLLRNRHGALVLKFDLVKFLQDYLLFGEEQECHVRDKHGRFPLAESSLARYGLLHEPLLNQYLFAVLAVACGNSDAEPCRDPGFLVLPPAVVLSHDCDQLRGNDFYTQSIRLYRAGKDLLKLRAAGLRSLAAFMFNIFAPKRHFYDDVLAMADLESQFGFKSVFYFLNGMGGRYGARSGTKDISSLVGELPGDAEIGIHYNYKYAHDPKALLQQKEELERICGRRISSGRAHYLAIDFLSCLDKLTSTGILQDESVGFVELNSFRVGFAGAYRFATSQCRLGESVMFIPMHFMDKNTAQTDGPSDLYVMLSKVEQVGGLVTLLFHPGTFHSFEKQNLKGLYYNHLKYMHSRRYRSFVPGQLNEQPTS